jgi:uncharacterized protein YndB with AHSA1/START domain/DNA-binding transcriptional ArsR family regulator
VDADLLQALAEPSRLRIVELLGERPHTVGEVAAALELRQPQVTKHLQTLARAGIVTIHPLGQRRVCALERSRIAELRDWLDGFLREEPAGAVLEEYRRAVDAETAAAQRDPAWAEGRVLRLLRTVPGTPAEVWSYWTTAERLASWWAPDHFRVAECEVDPRPGGAMRLVLQEGDGARYASEGFVLKASPPHALDFVMGPLGPDGTRLFEATHAVRFDEHADGTQLALEIRITSSTAPAAPAIAGMRTGWEQSLQKLARALARRNREEH